MQITNRNKEEKDCYERSNKKAGKRAHPRDPDGDGAAFDVSSYLQEQLQMEQDVNGTWVAEKEGNLNGTYYTYTVRVRGEEKEACDPYARTTGVNGKRAMVIDLASTNPEGWDSDADPNAGLTYNDAIIYELHVRDLSSDGSAGIKMSESFSV